jgi:hypothetical protein
MVGHMLVVVGGGVEKFGSCLKNDVRFLLNKRFHFSLHNLYQKNLLKFKE